MGDLEENRKAVCVDLLFLIRCHYAPDFGLCCHSFRDLRSWELRKATGQLIYKV